MRALWVRHDWLALEPQEDRRTTEDVHLLVTSLQGEKVCTRNTISEASLVDCVVRIIRQRYLSSENLDRLRKAIRQQQAQNSPLEPLDVDGIRRRLAELNRQIDNGAERIFSAPPRLFSMSPTAW